MPPLMSAFVVMGALLGILGFLVRGMRPAKGRGRYGAKRWRDLDSYRPAEDVTAWAAPAIALLAVVAIFDRSRGAAATSGLVLGLLAVATPDALRRPRDVALSAFGAVAAVVVAGRYLAGTVCSPTSTMWRLLFLVAALAAFAACAAGGMVARGIDTRLGLGAFSVIEVLVFVASPFGVQLTGFGMVAALGVAAGFGALVGIFPVVGLTLAAVGVAVASVGMTEMSGDACSPASHLAAMALFCFGLVLVVGRNARIRRSR